MAVDVCSEIVSPRISFSHDLKDPDFIAIESHHARSDASHPDFFIDFNFCIDGHGYSQHISSADELFANGKILPVEVNKLPESKQIHQFEPILVHTKPNAGTKVSARAQDIVENVKGDAKQKRLIEFLSSSFDEEEKEAEEDKASTKPFWQFKRSSSVNCDNNQSKPLLRSLTFLSRSNSTGSALNAPSKQMQKQNSVKERSIARSNSTGSAPNNLSSTRKVMHKQHSFKEPFIKRSNSLSNQYYSFSTSGSASLRKSNSRSYGNAVRISPVLNIPSTCIARGTVNLFRFGSLFCSGKSKNKKK